MLYTNTIQNLTSIYPQLTRVWIKTGDPRMPLKSVWMDEVKVHQVAGDIPTVHDNVEAGVDTGELAEDHLLRAAGMPAILQAGTRFQNPIML
jgi:hypothetical protein